MGNSPSDIKKQLGAIAKSLANMKDEHGVLKGKTMDTLVMAVSETQRDTNAICGKNPKDYCHLDGISVSIENTPADLGVPETFSSPERSAFRASHPSARDSSDSRRTTGNPGFTKKTSQRLTQPWARKRGKSGQRAAVEADC